MKLLLFVFFAFLFLSSCRQDTNEKVGYRPTIKEILSPCKEGGEPNLFVSETGQVYLSWMEYLNDTTDALQFAQLDKEGWSSPQTIATGTDWFVNWADFPSIVAKKGHPNSLAAHWLQKSASGTYDYDVRISQSADQGKTWSSSFIPHSDGITAEHGFLSMLPMDSGNILAIWLDGRFSKTPGEEEEGHGHGGGAMTLRTAEFNEKGQLFEEAELDHRICDCCQTDLVMTSAGPIAVYRDRSEEEIRDISIVRKVDGQWTAPRKVAEDQWKIAGCPVNGPAIAAQGASVAVAWFTAATNKGQVNIAFSSDAGQSFSSPIRLDDGLPIGRVDVVWIDTETALVSWIETVNSGGEIRLAKVTSGGKTGDSISLTAVGVSRQSGFPILEKLAEQYLMTWTSVEEESTVKTISFTL